MVLKKSSDAEIIRLNSVGLSLATIAERLDCHPSTVTGRLRSLGISPADTRFSFMESILNQLTYHQQDWLADQLGPHLSIKDFVKNLLVKEYLNKGKS